MRKPTKKKTMDAEDRADAKKGIKQSPAEERADKRQMAAKRKKGKK